MSLPPDPCCQNQEEGLYWGTRMADSPWTSLLPFWFSDLQVCVSAAQAVVPQPKLINHLVLVLIPLLQLS